MKLVRFTHFYGSGCQSSIYRKEPSPIKESKTIYHGAMVFTDDAFCLLSWCKTLKGNLPNFISMYFLFRIKIVSNADQAH